MAALAKALHVPHGCWLLLAQGQEFSKPHGGQVAQAGCVPEHLTLSTPVYTAPLTDAPMLLPAMAPSVPTTQGAHRLLSGAFGQSLLSASVSSVKGGNALY